MRWIPWSGGTESTRGIARCWRAICKTCAGLRLPIDTDRGRYTKSMKATFAAGCFWGVEATFRQTAGVISTAVGYEGGSKPEPTYKEVCSGRTGHAEAVQVEFDPARVSYGQLLDIFWANHDPTTLNRQGPDTGTQYRSAVFFHDAEQERAARASKETWQAK